MSPISFLFCDLAAKSTRVEMELCMCPIGRVPYPAPERGEGRKERGRDVGEEGKGEEGREERKRVEWKEKEEEKNGEWRRRRREGRGRETLSHTELTV